MMKVLQGLFFFIAVSSTILNAILFLYVEWSYISQSFIQIFNPLLHFQVIFTLLVTPLFWILLIISVVTFFAIQGLESFKNNN